MKPTTDKKDTPRVRSLFLEALDKAAGPDREAYLDEACRRDAQLRARVEALLKAHDEAGGFLHPPNHPSDDGLETAAPAECPGTVIGRYKLLEKIGEGGMAVVYMAEQTELIRRKVALKIIKLGMDTRQVIARFEAERQALALMDHPCIAKVLDAGATDTGRPYFVMELVQGISITEYCDKNSLSTKNRLHLFLQVCHAVQHAHQKGIIHRDIKPSNVMVTHHDGQPVPKVIDFGIAKATSQKLTEKTLFTRYAHIIGTPAYMSPEQAELNDLDIDTRSDIYSLGVLLYELLTGTTPFSEEELRKAGYAEMQRVIREQEPIKPSTRIRTARRSTGILPVSIRGILPLRSVGVPPMTSDHGQDARGTHGQDSRATHGRDAHATEVRGDLDWIVMKTLEKDRTRRYETASGLAEDIRRHLEHEPVLARGPGTIYRLGRLLRRHRVPVLAALVMVAIAMAAGILLSRWSRDRQQLAEAEDLRHQAEHKEILFQAREQHAKGERQAALETIQRIFDSPHVGPDARLLGAAILIEDGRLDDAKALLDHLLQDRPVIAGAAHAFLARLLSESGPLDAEKVKEIEEHGRQAEARRPATAEAYFLRAMTAVTVKDQLAALDKALELDPEHYESLRLRALTYYAAYKYDRLRDDALVMTILRRGDPLGHSLQAVVWRELGRYQDAIDAYDRARSLTPPNSPQYLDLSSQRCETMLRMGNYPGAVSEAQACRKLFPDKPVFQYDLFAALTALGDYENASAVFREIVRPSAKSRRDFERWCQKYVFDALEARRAWHPANHAPAGAAFLPLLEIEEAYHLLSTKGGRMIVKGSSPHWSPDGRKFAFCAGAPGAGGIATYDLATRETELLSTPGRYPRWSPDGQYIAFVRDRQFLRVPAFVSAARRGDSPPNVDVRREEEVWVVKADGTEARRLAAGGWPSWSPDSTSVYYQSRIDNTLNSISIESPDAEPKQIMKCSYAFPALSPDGRCVAYWQDSFLKVQELASQALVAQWPAAAAIWSHCAWSPGGNEIWLALITGWEGRSDRVWVYRLDGSEPAKAMSWPIDRISRSPDGTKLVFHVGSLGSSFLEIWMADVDPNTPTSDTLGPGQTREEHLRDILGLYTRRIEADPQDAVAYSDRAWYHDSLHEQLKAQIDMQRWSAVMSGRSPSGLWFGTPRDLGGILDLPFDCELVFSAERPVNTIPTMSVAFGQKGSREMKTFKIPLFIMSMMGCSLFPDLGAPKARAGFTVGVPVNLGPGVNTSSSDNIRAISADGCVMYFGSDRPGGYGSWDVYVTTRQSKDEAWGPASNLGPIINSSGFDVPCLVSADGLSLYLTSNRAGGYGGTDIYVARRAAPDAPWGTPENLGPTINSPWEDQYPSISPDRLSLYFTSNRPGGFGGYDLWVTTRAALSDPWGPPVNLGSTVNSVYAEFQPSISVDGSALFFAYDTTNGAGPDDIYVTTRTSVSDPWNPPIKLGPPVNTSADDYSPSMSSDGSTLYWCSTRPEGYGRGDIWQAPIIPVVDFNGDGKVDAKDLALLMADWGKSTSLCDIGPCAWGDGIVDEKDLGVLMESLVAPKPRASDVPCDATLSWISPSFAQTCDVYFGNSFETVNSAERTNPRGVLVSQGQTATVYSPAAPLKVSQTYYWRVDFVIAGPTPTIIKGPVLQFTTAALIYPIKNITATASSAQAGSGPEKTVDRSGLDKTDGHSTDVKDMWWTQPAAPHWIQYEFDKVYTLHRLWVWNFNSAVEPFIGFGAKTVKIEYSVDGATWTPLAHVPEFDKAFGQAGYRYDTTVNFGDAPARYVKLTIEKNWGVVPQTGLSEVRFFCIQSAAVPKP